MWVWDLGESLTALVPFEDVLAEPDAGGGGVQSYLS